MENKGKLHDASTGTAMVGKKAHFGTKQCGLVKRSNL